MSEFKDIPLRGIAKWKARAAIQATDKILRREDIFQNQELLNDVMDLMTRIGQAKTRDVVKVMIRIQELYAKYRMPELLDLLPTEEELREMRR